MSVVISNPPYNMKWEHPFFASNQERFNLGLPPKNNANFAFVLSALETSVHLCVLFKPTIDSAIVNYLILLSCINSLFYLP